MPNPCAHPCETVLTVLYGRLSALSATALRRDVLPERVPIVCLLVLRDGETGEPEVTFSPLRRHDRHRIEIKAVVQENAARNATFNTLCASISATLVADCMRSWPLRPD